MSKLFSFQIEMYQEPGTTTGAGGGGYPTQIEPLAWQTGVPPVLPGTKQITVIARRGTFRLGQRFPKLKLTDAKGKSVMIELAHVLQQRPGPGRTADGQPVEQVSFTYARIDHTW